MAFTQRRAGVATPIRLRGRNGSGTVKPRVRTPDPPPVAPSGDTVYAPEPLGAGGWVTGITISPDGLTRLARTDTMGAWRWDTTTDAWVASISATTMPADGSAALDQGQGVQAIAAANSVAYMGYKTSIYKSTDRGKHWTVSLTSGPATAPNTGEQRWWNSRMSIDPADSTTCLYGTLAGGLYTTTNAGTSWTQVSSSSVPVGLAGYGIVCTAVDTSGSWYAAPFGNGVYRSTDRGSSWAKISSDSDFTSVTGMAAGPNGDVMVTAHTTTATTDPATSVIFRYRTGAWTNVSPTGASNLRKWRPIAYDPLTPGRCYTQGDGGYERISLDYGTTWAAPFHDITSDGDVPWLAASNGFGVDFFFITIGGLQFDPVVSGRIWMSQGIGVWYADLPVSTTTRVPWQAQSRGIEQLVVNDVLCPPGLSPLVSSWDRPVFIVGETGAVPTVTIAPPAATPIGTPGGLSATLVAGYPTTITYGWTVLSKPGGSAGGSFTSTNSLTTAFTPDVAGTYVLRLTSTNSRGATTTDVTMTATGTVRGLVLPVTTGNYFSAPDSNDLDLTGSLTLRAKVSLVDWTPGSVQFLVGKVGSNEMSYDMRIDTTGAISVDLYSAGNGSTGALNRASSVLGFPDGSIQWVQAAYDATAKLITFSKSIDGTTWTTVSTLSTSGTLGVNPIYSGAGNLCVGSDSGNSKQMNGTVYRAQVLTAAGTVLADFNAETVTRTGTRLPATITDSTGKVWTSHGTAWDWS